MIFYVTSFYFQFSVFFFLIFHHFPSLSSFSNFFISASRIHYGSQKRKTYVKNLTNHYFFGPCANKFCTHLQKHILLFFEKKLCKKIQQIMAFFAHMLMNFVPTLKKYILKILKKKTLDIFCRPINHGLLGSWSNKSPTQL